MITPDSDGLSKQGLMMSSSGGYESAKATLIQTFFFDQQFMILIRLLLHFRAVAWTVQWQRCSTTAFFLPPSS
jgi:hypothetical protein